MVFHIFSTKKKNSIKTTRAVVFSFPYMNRMGVIKTFCWRKDKTQNNFRILQRVEGVRGLGWRWLLGWWWLPSCCWRFSSPAFANGEYVLDSYQSSVNWYFPIHDQMNHFNPWSFYMGFCIQNTRLYSCWYLISKNKVLKRYELLLHM